ncbi:MAG: sulfite exporter TauE/SafE family protein [Tepidisphaerales bacterium]
MMALVAAIVVASVLGSLHCAGMCGAFLAVAVSSPGESPKVAPQVAYHLGRLTTYLVMGAAAGLAGSLLNLGGVLSGVGPVAAVLAGMTMLAFGTVTLLQLRGWKVRMPTLPGGWTRRLSAAVGKAMSLPVVPRAAVIGLLTTLLPCGWLYAFVATAAGTGHVLTGMAAMAAFWVGTLPVMVALGVGVRTALGAMGRWVPQLTCVAMMALGVWTLTGRSMLSVENVLQRTHAAVSVPGEAAAHDSAAGDAASGGAQPVIQPVRPACCSGKADAAAPAAAAEASQNGAGAEEGEARR